MGPPSRKPRTRPGASSHSHPTSHCRKPLPGPADSPSHAHVAGVLRVVGNPLGDCFSFDGMTACLCLRRFSPGRREGRRTRQPRGASGTGTTGNHLLRPSNPLSR